MWGTHARYGAAYALLTRGALSTSCWVCHCEQKYYFYAETDGSGVLFMAEVSFASASRRLSAVIKGPTKASEGQGFVKLFKHTLNGLISEQ